MKTSSAGDTVGVMEKGHGGTTAPKIANEERVEWRNRYKNCKTYSYEVGVGSKVADAPVIRLLASEAALRDALEKALDLLDDAWPDAHAGGYRVQKKDREWYMHARAMLTEEASDG